MGRTTLSEEYFTWLYNLISKQKLSYRKLCRELHLKTFGWSVPNDDNRCEDGLNLRNLFIEECDLDESHLEVRYFLKGDCTVFEVLVSLAQRINELMYDLKNPEDHTARWFLEMVRNLGLGIYVDGYNLGKDFDPVTEAKIDEILVTLIERTYDFYGRGGLFPLKRRPPKDQTNVEIWYQLMNYLDENYGL